MVLRTRLIRPKAAALHALGAAQCVLNILFLHAGVPEGKPTFPGGSDNGYQFENLFDVAIDLLPPSAQYSAVNLKTYQVCGETWEYPSADELADANAILIGGSATSVYDDIDWIRSLHAFVDGVRQTRPHIKLLGICWGQQLLGQILGVPCRKALSGGEIGPIKVPLSPEAQTLCKSVLPDHPALNAGLLTINSNHQDELHSVPVGYTSFGSIDACEVQGFFGPPGAVTAKDVQVLAIQSHPEWVKQAFLGFLDYHEKAGSMTTETIARLRKEQETASWDGLVLGALMLAVAGW